MSSKLGNKIPKNIVDSLESSRTGREGSVIFLITTDPDGFPHIALLSPYQVIIEDESTIYFSLYKRSSSHDFLIRNKKFTLIIQDLPALLYLKCQIISFGNSLEEINDESHQFFKAKTTAVLMDVSDRAPLISELLFETKGIKDEYNSEFLGLSEFVKKLRE
ncbi:MAG: hypothetical protein B2I17_03555 [Thermoplasmatales archaeon B_DKE]|nr:MAG: hypothetical protein B2I17_03555 [Thermoplasmatales archaeon B_DKE]